MMITESRKRTFEAAWAIQRMMWDEGLFVDFFETIAPGPSLVNNLKRSDQKIGKDRRWYEPSSDPTSGCLCTTRGLDLHFHYGNPIWMTTPWGEWWCWQEGGGGEGVSPHLSTVPHAVMTKIFAKFSVYGEVNSFHDSTVRLREVSGIALPPPTRVSPRDLDQNDLVARRREWIALCEAMTPPRYPIWSYYVQADVPVPRQHPDFAYACEQIKRYMQPNMASPFGTYGEKHSHALF